MSDAEAGKLTLIADLDILSKGQRKFICQLSRLRNQLVHKIENTQFTFPDYIAGLDANQKRSFVEIAGRGVVDEPEFSGIKIPKSQFILENPKVCLWLSASEVLACIRLEEENIAMDQWEAELTAIRRFQEEQMAELHQTSKTPAGDI